MAAVRLSASFVAEGNHRGGTKLKASGDRHRDIPRLRISLVETARAAKGPRIALQIRRPRQKRHRSNSPRATLRRNLRVRTLSVPVRAACRWWIAQPAPTTKKGATKAWTASNLRKTRRQLCRRASVVQFRQEGKLSRSRFAPLSVRGQQDADIALLDPEPTNMTADAGGGFLASLSKKYPHCRSSRLPSARGKARRGTLRTGPELQEALRAERATSSRRSDRPLPAGYFLGNIFQLTTRPGIEFRCSCSIYRLLSRPAFRRLLGISPPLFTDRPPISPPSTVLEPPRRPGDTWRTPALSRSRLYSS